MVSHQVHPETGDPFPLQSCKSLTQYLVKNIGSFLLDTGLKILEASQSLKAMICSRLGNVSYMLL